MDACLTSQFEQHIRAICGLPLGNPAQHTPVIMVNLLGQHVDLWLDEVRKKPPAALEIKTHLYGKAKARKDRKMGHLNILADDLDEALAWIDDVGVWTDLTT
jgi:5-(carboxyamino)imidazole ribonucleotide synthase